MKGSKLLADANMDIKIERGLKILQFAGEYNLRRAFYRNCPLNTFGDVEQGASSKVKVGVLQLYQQNADILIDLNEEVSNWGRQALSPQKSPKKQEKLMKIEKNVLSPQPSREQQEQSRQQNSKQDEADQGSLDALSNYESQATKKRLKSIAEDPAEAVQLSKSQNLNPTSMLIDKNDKNSDSYTIRVENKSNISIHSNRSAQSAHSKKSVRQKVEQVTQQELKMMQNKKTSDIQVSKSNIHEKTHRSIKEEPVIKKKQEAIKNQSKISSSQKYSFLDKSISKIVSNTSQIQSKLSINQSNVSDFSLMRQLSASFQDEQNMKLLLKLQNCELEQGYLQRRIVNRLEKGYRQVNCINDITWESLKLPKMSPGFVRPNYAHLIE